MSDEECLIVQWVDHRGKTWDLSGGTDGVILDLGQEGLELPGVEHQWVRGGMQWAGSQLRRAEPTLRIEVGGDLTGSAYYQLADEWWSEANRVDREGVLRVTRPDGMVRELRCRLRDAPGTSWQHDPGMSFHRGQDRVEAWMLAGSTAYWQGREQVSRFGMDVVEGKAPSAIPFFGPEGHGWPLYVSQPEVAVLEGGKATLDNLGQGPMWVTWRLVGPLNNPRVGVGKDVLAYQGRVEDGEVVVITTPPGSRTVTEIGTGESRFGRVGGTYAPVPVGEDIDIVVAADGMTSTSRIEVSGRPQYLRPW